MDKLNHWHITSVSRALLLGFAIVAQKARNITASIYQGENAGTTIIESRTVDTRQMWVMVLCKQNRNTAILEDGIWKKVRKIEKSGNVNVWNITVKDDESYTAEGCIVKNCPLQFDIIERLIKRYSNEQETILDPFAGLFSVAYKALEMNRKSIGIELNSEYFADGLYYINAMTYKLLIPTLFEAFESEGEKC